MRDASSTQGTRSHSGPGYCEMRDARCEMRDMRPSLAYDHRSRSVHRGVPIVHSHLTVRSTLLLLATLCGCAGPATPTDHTDLVVDTDSDTSVQTPIHDIVDTWLVPSRTIIGIPNVNGFIGQESCVYWARFVERTWMDDGTEAECWVRGPMNEFCTWHARITPSRLILEEETEVEDCDGNMRPMASMADLGPMIYAGTEDGKDVYDVVETTWRVRLLSHDILNIESDNNGEFSFSRGAAF